jgi:hypothetical protein
MRSTGLKHHPLDIDAAVMPNHFYGIIVNFQREIMNKSHIDEQTPFYEQKTQLKKVIASSRFIKRPRNQYRHAYREPVNPE